MWGGILLYVILTDFEKVTITIVIVTGILTVIGTVLDFVAGIFDTKMCVASWLGVFGALVGSSVGFIISNILGIFIGAFIGEYLKYKKAHLTMKAGIGTMLGLVFGIVLKIFSSFLMIGIFIVALFW